jgi:hypothetical protein
MAVRLGRVPPRIAYYVRGGPLLSIRVAQSSPLPDRERRSGEPVLPCQLFLVHHRHSHAAGFRS